MLGHHRLVGGVIRRPRENRHLRAHFLGDLLDLRDSRECRGAVVAGADRRHVGAEGTIGIRRAFGEYGESVFIFAIGIKRIDFTRRRPDDAADAGVIDELRLSDEGLDVEHGGLRPGRDQKRKGSLENRRSNEN